MLLTVYSRPDCHLCEEMVAELVPLLEGKARVRIVDISDDGELTARYGLSIPVLTCGDEELSRYRLDRERVLRFLRQPAD